jgi:hypothetical protein
MSSLERRIKFVIAVVLLGIVAGLSAETGDRPKVIWRERLEALEPQRPMDYFELAEEVADVAVSPDDRALARRLFALAGLLDRPRLGRSTCLALADLAQRPVERKRLLALASLIGGERIGPTPMGAVSSTNVSNASMSDIMDLLGVFSDYRRGRGQDARDALRDPQVYALLEQVAPHLRGGVAGFIEDCNMYRGELRPSLSRDDLNRMLRLEVGLLSGDHRPWSADLLLTGGEPMIEVDPDDLSTAFGYDASRPYFRNGEWVDARSPDSDLMPANVDSTNEPES